jgi:hypothetical protein
MKIAAFYGLLSVPIILWAILVLPIYFSAGPDLSSNLVYGIVAVSPIVGGDVSLFGEVTPVVLAGAIIALLPNTKQDIKLIAIFMAILSYVLFVHLTIFFTSGPGVGLISANWDKIDEPRKILLGVMSNIRVMAIVIAASIVGFKVKPVS